MSKIYSLVISFLIKKTTPCILVYFAFCSNPLFNIAATDATGIEKIANDLLIPYQYLFTGKSAHLNAEGMYTFSYRFTYKKHFYIKTVGSLFCVIPSFVVGGFVKTFSLLFQKSAERHSKILQSCASIKVFSNKNQYELLGIDLSYNNQSPLKHCGYKRRPEAMHYFNQEKEVLQKIISLFNEHNIFYWIDCGTLLGAYRYGGVIPWDHDLDIAVLRQDFDNIIRVLNHLDSKKYKILDWSTRDFEKSLIKVYIKETGTMIDIYQFSIHPEDQTLQLVFAFDQHLFFPQWWKQREKQFTTPISYHTVFPLRKAYFDGIEVRVPNKTKKYLMTFYGLNIEPAKVYNEKTCEYEKVPGHPYWKFER